jgi:hypothetical protein
VVTRELHVGHPRHCLAVFPVTNSLRQATSAGSNCTEPGFVGTIQIDVTPTTSSTVMAFLTVQSNDASLPSYSLEVSCLVGANGCLAPPPPPPCTLKDVASYSATTSTVTMNFTVGNTSAATWNAWLTYQNTMESPALFSVSQPITNPPVVVTKTTSLAKEGKVGVLSTLTTPTGGIICASWVQIATGAP